MELIAWATFPSTRRATCTSEWVTDLDDNFLQQVQARRAADHLVSGPVPHVAPLRAAPSSSSVRRRRSSPRELHALHAADRERGVRRDRSPRRYSIAGVVGGKTAHSICWVRAMQM